MDAPVAALGRLPRDNEPDGCARPDAPMPVDDVERSPIRRYLQLLHARYAGLHDGAVATYIPELAKVDPKSAARLHPNDVVRVSRALEVFELTGEPLSDIQAKHAFATHRYDAALFAIAMPREQIHDRIEKRIGLWLAAG